MTYIIEVRYQSFGGLCCLHLQVGNGKMGLCNVDILPHDHTASQPRISQIESSLP